MLIAESNQPFDSPDYFFELKLDGIRCLAYLDSNSTNLRNKRNKNISILYPELSHIHKQVNRHCILDGELVVLKNGKPDFQEIQRRSLMSNPFKIKLAADKLPVCFTAYDLLYVVDKLITDKPLTRRVEILESLVTETPALSLSRRIEEKGITLFNVAKEQELEGIIAKRMDSLYFPGKRTKDWVKIKNLIDEDFIVCGYYINERTTASVILGTNRDGKIIYQGHVSMGISRHDFKLMEQSERADVSAYQGFPHFPGAVWLAPRLICTVKYMERTNSGSLRQPVFKGIRVD
jgi:bifunctional non-homologous end joining protein LigD/DNA ligase-1